MVTSFAALLFWLLLAVGVVYELAKDKVFPFLLVYMTIYIVPMLLLMELQPRYMHVLWYLGAPYVAVGLTWLCGGGREHDRGRWRASHVVNEKG